MTIELSCRDQERLRDAVRDVLGLWVEDARLEDFGRALSARLAVTGADVPGYLRLLRDPDRNLERRAVAELLTVNETHFFRNLGQFQAFSEVAVPELLRATRANRRLRVLSAGCSSGEEAYSIAIVLQERFPELVASWDVRIVGIDIHGTRLSRARQGRYSSWSLRETPQQVRRRWFREDGSEHVLDERILRMVTFEERNLLDEDPAFWWEGALDACFFRNVGMYFPLETMRAVTNRIARALAPGGFLFLGHAETLRGISQDFHLRHSCESFYYQRRRPEDEEANTPDAAVPFTPSPPSPPDASAWLGAIGLASERIAALERRPQGRTIPAASLAETRSPPPPDRCQLSDALELLREDRLSDAMAVLAKLDDGANVDPDTALLRAVILTSSGKMDEAEKACEELLGRDDLNAGAHYLAALCQAHRGNLPGAIEHNRAAAHIDPSFAMPHLHLGLLARRGGGSCHRAHRAGAGRGTAGARGDFSHPSLRRRLSARGAPPAMQGRSARPRGNAMSPGESPAAALRRAFDMAFAKEPPPAADLVDLIALRAGAWTCAVRVSDIAGVMPLGTVVPYPSDDTSLLGLIAVRASPLPVYDLAARLGEGSARAPRWALLSSGNAQIALAVDEIEGYLRVLRGELLAALPITEVPAAARAGELLRIGSSPIPVVAVPAIVRQLAQQLGQDTKER